MDNRDIAIVFNRLATMLEIEGANPFRVRAYREAARVLGEMLEPAARLAIEELARLPGIGKDLAAKIRDVAETGTTAMFDEMKLKVPLEVVALTELQGMGPKRVKMLLERGIRNLQQLESAARAGGLNGLPGFGATLQRKILEAIERAAQSGGRVLLSAAWPVAEELVTRLRAIPGVTHAETAGSFRRRRETVGDLDLLVCGGAPETVMEALTGYDRVGEILARGETKSSVRLISGLQVDLRLVPEESFGAALLYFTGNKQHNIELRKIAIANGWSLSEYGIADDHEQILAGRTEEEVYRKLGLEWVPPELREARDEIDRARRGALPRLIELSDLRADLHMHSDRSDGRDTLETMVRAARDRGYGYCAVTEHSQSLAMAQGFDTERVRRSVSEIEAVRRAVPGIRVLHGLEVDILGDGQLDLDDEGLGLLDWVIASLHSRLGQPRAEMTARVMRAVSHPAVHVMGHPTARMLGRREPVELDLEAVLDAAAAHGTWMEINAQPHRVDLNDQNARMAKERGVRLVINTDAHSVSELDALRYGVFAARRAGLAKGDVVNTLEADAFLATLASRKARGPRSAIAVSATPSVKPTIAQPKIAKPKIARAKVAQAKIAKPKVARAKIAKPKTVRPTTRRGKTAGSTRSPKPRGKRRP
jgi:DNA polymerase (family 10)